VQIKLQHKVNSVASGRWYDQGCRPIVHDVHQGHRVGKASGATGMPFVFCQVEWREAAEAIGMSRLPDGGATVNFLVGKIGQDLVACMVRADVVHAGA
jgi:hypothetical protein